MHLKDISNRKLRKKLLREDNLPLLEDCIEAEKEKLRPFMQKDPLIWEEGERKELDRKGLEDMLADIKPIVDTFLGVSIKDSPRIDYKGLFKLNPESASLIGNFSVCVYAALRSFAMLSEQDYLGSLIMGIPTLTGLCLEYVLYNHCFSAKTSYYTPIGNRIMVSKAKEHAEKFPHAVIAHEYAHYVQTRTGCSHLMNIICREGHASGVSGHVLDVLGIPDFFAVAELKEVYDAISQNKRANYHSIGTSALYLEEMEQGRQIYRQLLDGTFEFKVLK